MAIQSNIEAQIKQYIDNPQELLQRKPLRRSVARSSGIQNGAEIDGNTSTEVSLPKLRWATVTQEKLLQELHPESHDVLYDANIPYISVRLEDGSFQNVQHKRIALPYQRTIRNKALLHLCGNNTEHTLLHNNPNEREELLFTTFKQYWNIRNQDGMRYKAVREQMSVGMAGWLFYFDRYGQIQSKILPFEDGYVLCPHFDDKGDTLINSVYYQDKKGIDRLDSYDDIYIYKHVRNVDAPNSNSETGWILEDKYEHGFSRCPLIIQQGQVAWDDAQNIIEVYEILYNIFTVIMKRHGWGILYIKGNLSEKVEKLAGSIILKDTSHDGKGEAEFKTPPNPDGMFDMLKSLEERMQIAASTTFLLPKDISMSGEISGLAIMLTQSGDNEKAQNYAIEWQDSIDKATFLFKEGLAKELVDTGEIDTAVTEYSMIKIGSKFIPWMPKSITEMAQVLNVLIASGVTSKETATEIMASYGVNKPSEKQRVAREVEDAVAKEIALATTAQTQTQPIDETSQNNE